MALTSNGGESMYKLSKRPRVRTVMLSPSSGNSSSDLEAIYTTAPCSASNNSIDTVKSRNSRRSVKEAACKDGMLDGQEIHSTDEDEVDVPMRVRKKTSRAENRISKAANMRLQLSLSKSTSRKIRDGFKSKEMDGYTVGPSTNRMHSSKYAAIRPALDTGSDGDDMRGMMISPIRRRSFFTPGLATRNPIDVLAKPPAPTKKEQLDWDYYYNPYLSASSPLERIAALDLAGRPITPLTRAVTPADRDYGMIGRLRITNASPAPSTKTYNTAATKPSANRESLFDSIDAPFAPLQSVGSAQETSPKTNVLPGEERPFSQDSIALNYADIFGGPAGWLQKRDGYEVKFHKRSKSCDMLTSSDKTSEIARDYMSGLDNNPFNVSKTDPAIHSFQATTKPSEIDAELFDASSVRAKSSVGSLADVDYSLPEVVSANDGFQEDVSRLLARIGRSSSTLNTIGRDSAFERASYHDRQADSGYQSSSSTTSYRKNLGFHCGRDSSEALAMDSMIEEDPDVSRTTSKSKRRPAPVTIPTASTLYDSVFSRSAQDSMDSVPTLSSVGIFSEKILSVTNPKKLQKSRPRSLPPPVDRVTIQMHPEIDPDSVPNVPNELVDRMVKRSAELPPLVHTLPSVGHVRLEKEDYLKAPLSAPIRFPSPQPVVDRIWDQTVFANNRRAKAKRNRHSSAGTMSGKKSTKPTITNSSASNVTSLENVDSFLRALNSPLADNIQSDPTPCHSGPIRALRNPSGMSQVNESSDSDVRLAARIARAQSVPLMESIKPSNNTIRKASSVYTEPSPAMASSVWTDASPFLRQASSVYSAAVGSSPQMDISKMSSRTTSGTQFPPFTTNSMSSSLSIDTKSKQARSTSSDKKSPGPVDAMDKATLFDGDSETLPPLPAMPTKYIKQHSERSKTVDSIDKDLPPLPHQRKTSDHVIPRGLSPCREADDQAGTRAEPTRLQRSSLITPSRAPSVAHEASKQSATRLSNIQSEPPYQPSIENLPALHIVERSPSHSRKPTVPKLSESCSGQVITKPRTLIWETLMQSPECDSGGFSSDSNSYCSYSPERNYYKWAPPKPESSHYRRHSDWPQILRDVPSRLRESQISWDHEMTLTQLIPEGLKTRKTSPSGTVIGQYQNAGEHYLNDHHNGLRASMGSLGGATGLGLDEAVHVSGDWH